MKVLETLEENSRMMDMKRKSEEVSKKRSKKMKFERLEGWGEAQVELPASWNFQMNGKWRWRGINLNQENFSYHKLSLLNNCLKRRENRQRKLPPRRRKSGG